MPNETANSSVPADLLATLSSVLGPDAIGPWLMQPNAAFGGKSPSELIQRGEIDRLWSMIHQLQSGDPS